MINALQLWFSLILQTVIAGAQKKIASSQREIRTNMARSFIRNWVLQYRKKSDV